MGLVSCQASIGVFPTLPIPASCEQDSPLNAGDCAFVLLTMASLGVAPNRYRDRVQPELPPYVFKDAVGSALRSTMAMGAIGLFFSSVQNTLTKQNTNAWGVVTKFGGTTTNFGMDARQYALGLRRG